MTNQTDLISSLLDALVAIPRLLLEALFFIADAFEPVEVG